jgi:hypothetical protein
MTAVILPVPHFLSTTFFSLLEFTVGIAVSAEEPQLWRTVGKAYNLWICELVHSLIEYTDDQILR